MKDKNAEIKVGLGRGTADTSGDCPDIWVDPEVEKRIGDYVATDTTKELAGVLLGEVVTDADGSLVRVLAEIEAKHTEAVHTSVTFTHATWEDIYRVKDEKFPELKIVGWFHSHPGFGIFLSRWDMFIQQNFFNLPWQIAYVVDPVNRTNGFFRWENGKVEQFDKTRREVFVPAEIELMPRRRRRSAAITALNLLLIFGLTMGVIYLWFLRPPKVKVVEKVVEKVKVVHDNQFSSAKSTEPAAGEYVVRQGDCLWAISRHVYGDSRYMGVIARFNGFEMARRLHTGQKLSLPSKESADRMIRNR